MGVPRWCCSPTMLVRTCTGGCVAVLLCVRPLCSLEAASSACQLSQGKVGLQTPQLQQAESKHAVPSYIIEGDGAPESCPNRFPGNMYLEKGDAMNPHRLEELSDGMKAFQTTLTIVRRR